LKQLLPPENFYPGISLNYDLGYGSEGEYNIVKNILKGEAYPTSDAYVKQALELSKSAYLFLDKHCQGELKQWNRLSKTEVIVGCDIIATVGLAHLILGCALASLKIGKTLLDTLKHKSQEEDLLEGVMKKLENTEEGIIVARKTTEFEIDVKKRKRKGTRNLRAKKK
jgi:hypothetical protein